MDRPSALWITNEAPHRGLGGGNIRQSHLLAGLAAVLEVDLLLATNDGGEPDDYVKQGVRRSVSVTIPPQPTRSKTRARARGLAGALTPLGPIERQEGAASCRALRPAVTDLGKTYDLYVVNHFALAPLLSGLRGSATCLETQRIPSRDAQQRLPLTLGRRQRWLQEHEIRGSERLEAWAVANSRHVVTVSEQDAGALPAECLVAPNGVDVDLWSRLQASRAEPTVVFTGTLNYGPNVDGLGWFCADVWPHIRRAIPSANFEIVGRNPVEEVKALARCPGVTVTPDVPDTRPYLDEARVVVVPLRFGSGTRLKVLEALACGRPLVGTSIGLEGLGIVDGVHAFVRDDADTFARGVVAALDEDWNPDGMIDEGSRLAQHFSWQAISSRHAEALAGWADRARAAS